MSRKPLPGYPVKKKFQTMEEVNEYFDQEKLTCLLCGREYISLHAHTNNAHGVSAEQYKARYGIPWKRGLVAKSLKAKQAAIMNEQRAKGILPQQPSKEHIRQLSIAKKDHARPVQPAVRESMRQHALKTHGRSEKWGKKDFEEYLRRIKTGRTVTEVGKDKDMPCREVFDKYCRDNPAFDARFEAAWDRLPFSVQIRGQKTGERYKRRVVALRSEGLTWPEIATLLDISESTPRNLWHRLKKQGLLDQYLPED